MVRSRLINTKPVNLYSVHCVRHISLVHNTHIYDLILMMNHGDDYRVEDLYLSLGQIKSCLAYSVPIKVGFLLLIKPVEMWTRLDRRGFYILYVIRCPFASLRDALSLLLELFMMVEEKNLC